MTNVLSLILKMESWLPRITNAVIPDSGIETLIPGTAIAIDNI